MTAAHQPLLDGREGHVEDEPLLGALQSTGNPTDQQQPQDAIPQDRRNSPVITARVERVISSGDIQAGSREILIPVNHPREELSDHRSSCISNTGSPFYKKAVSVLYDMGAGYIATVGIAKIIESSLHNDASAAMFFSGMPYILSRLVNEAYLILRSQPEVPLQNFMSLYPRIGGSIAALLTSYATKEFPALSSPIVRAGLGFFAGKVAENVSEYVLTKGCCETTLRK